MAEHSRYYVSDETASVSMGILKNKLGIKSKKRLNRAETLLLSDTYTHFFELLQKRKVKFDLSLLFSIHKYFLGHLYDWAGKVRTVNISKDEMFFAPIKYIDQALADFDKLLKITLPKQSDNQDELAKNLAIIHNEFNIIHPFREGNGRTIRLFIDLIGVKSGYDPIDWSKKPKSEYIKACIKGAKGEHEPMAKIIKKGLKK
ncbi:MAG: Fic family protein [Candidatus Komeilibacteria bacterium]|nr:Fic family protein [Candidatus Komeilibacteria bacterium]